MTYLSGKGYYIWKAINCMAGRPQEIADAAFSADLGHVLIKIADGVFRYNVDVDLPAIVAALQAAGVTVWGWQYIYGGNPAAEAAIAIRQIQATGVTGFVVNAEHEFKEPGMGTRARTYMQTLRNGVGDLPIALSTYRYPSLHAPFPFNQFLEFCDIAMPQVYWLYSHDPVQQLARTLAEYYQLTTLPVIPTGAAWKQNSWQSTPADCTAFLQAAEIAGCEAANFWSWDASQHLPTWQAIATYDWPVVDEPAPPVEPEIPEDEMGEVLDKVNQVLANQERMLALLQNGGGEPEPPEEPEPPAPPEPLKYFVALTVDKTNARFIYRMKNETVPIFQIYPGDSRPVSERIQYFRNQTPRLEVDPNRVRGDGSTYCYKLVGRYGRGGEQLYVWSDECEKTW